MKILVNGTGSVAGGINRMLTSLAGELAQVHDVVVADAPVQTMTSLSDLGVPVRPQPEGPRALTVARAALVPRRPADVMIDVSPSLARRSPGAKLVTLVNDLGYKLNPKIDISPAQTRYRQLTLRRAVARSDLIVCISQQTQRELLEAFPQAAGKSSVIYPSVGYMRVPSSPPIKRDTRDPRALELVMFGHGKNKGVDIALSALLRRRDVGLTVFAPRWQLESYGYGTQLDRLQASGQLSVIEDADDDEAARRILGGDAFVMPSAYEGFGLPAAEAMWLGAPTVIAPSASLYEATRGGAVTMEDLTPDALLAAAEKARNRPLEEWSRERAAIRSWTWADFTITLLCRLEDAQRHVPDQS